jgi:hypothetical protein
VRQKVLAHLGKYPTPRRALARWERWIVRYRCVAAKLEGEAASTLATMSRDRKDPEDRQQAALFVDEDGNMRRRKYAPHERKEAYFRDGVLGIDYYLALERRGLGWLWTRDLYTKMQAEYWSKVDHAAMLRREAARMEGSYAHLCAAIGRCSEEEARAHLAAQQQRHEEAHTRRDRIATARQERVDVQMGLAAQKAAHKAALEAVGEKDPALALQLTLRGYTGPVLCPHCDGTGLAAPPGEAGEED